MHQRRKSIPAFSRKKLATLAAAALVLWAAYAAAAQIPARARGHLESVLKDAGFPQARVDRVRLGAASVTAENIKLDQFGFDEIKTLTADIHWPSFLLSGELSGITLTGLHIGRDSANISASLHRALHYLLNLPSYRVDISGAVVDVTTAYGEIRLAVETTIAPRPENGEREIKAIVRTDQYQLSFDSVWEGKANGNGDIDLSGKMEGGRLNIGPLRVSRFNGWAALSNQGGDYSVQSQMEAGSAAFMDVPLEKLSLVADYNGDRANFLFRTGLAGMQGTLFTADYTAEKEKSAFDMALRGGNMGSFLDYIEETTGRPKTITGPLLAPAPFLLTAGFQPERRFVGGPMPFGVRLETDGKQSLTGNLLIYPDTYDIRGSLESAPEMTTALQQYFKIPAEDISQNFIRIDGGARRLFLPGEPAPHPSSSGAAAPLAEGLPVPRAPDGAQDETAPAPVIEDVPPASAE